MVGIILYVSSSPLHAQSTIERVSVSSSGLQGNGENRYLSLSGNGRYIVFNSNSPNLVPNDTNNAWDVFVKDRETGIIERVSASMTGVQGNADSGMIYPASISADGRYVAFVSYASNLLPNDNNLAGTVVKDRQTGTIERVSASSTGERGEDSGISPSISANGRYVAFVSLAANLVPNDTNRRYDVFVKDRQTGILERVSVSSTGAQSEGDLYGYHNRPTLSADGRYVAFASFASDLVPNDTNNTIDVFVKDRQTGTLERVSVSSTGIQSILGSGGPFISANGRFVAFGSNSSNLVPGDTNNSDDIFVKDRQTGVLERASVSSTGTQSNGSGGGSACLSADGRYVAFSSFSELIPYDSNNKADVLVKDRQTGAIQRVSIQTTGVESNGNSGFSSISSDGRYVAFESYASNLVPNDTNNNTDVFVCGPLPSCTIIFQTELQSYVNFFSPGVFTFTFHSEGYPDEIRTNDIGISKISIFSGLPRRLYTVNIKGAKWLGIDVTVDASVGDTYYFRVLKAGDANNDNFVDIEDLLLLIAHYNSISPDANYLEAADFNGDARNDIGDLLLLVSNYNMHGD